jgi:hypothetical protein
VTEQSGDVVRPTFAGVGWIGGGTGSGKTTVARALASRHGLRLLPIDAFWYAHSARLNTPELTPDEQWLGQSPEEQADAFAETSRDRLLLAMHDLARLPKQPATLVEGPQVLPDLLPGDSMAVFLIPTKEFQRSVLARRALPLTADPAVALENRIRKDQLYAEQVSSRALADGFATLAVDGSRSPEEIVADVERLFAPILAASGDPVDLQPARRWENEVVADNAQRWLASADAPVEPPRAYPFSCECGRRGCSIRVELALEDFLARPRVVAPAHAGTDVGRTSAIGTVRSE